MKSRTLRRSLPVLPALLAAVVVGCGSSPGGGSENAATAAPEGKDAITAPVTAEQVAELGETTLKVWADAGEEKTLRTLIPRFEKEYPNVKVDVTVKGFDDLVKTVVNAAASDDPPDVFQGNQGYGVDGALAEANLMRPLDDVAKAYGWDSSFPAGALTQFRWTPGGAEFGSGDLFGISPVTEFVGVFYNQRKLRALGIAPPRTSQELSDALQKAADAGEQPVMLGNSDKYPATHVFGSIQGEQVDAETARAWVTGERDASFVTDGNRATADTLVEWARKGWLGKGFDGISPDDAVARFGAGRGVFLFAGVWNASALAEGASASDIGFMAPPPGDSGRSVATGSLGMGWHISSKTDALPAAVAWIGMLTDESFAQELADINRIPVQNQAVRTTNALFADQVEAARVLLADDGQTFYLDWATPDMYDEIGARTQELLAGRLDTDGYLEAIQKNWADFQARR